MRSRALIETAQPEEAKAILDQLVILPRLKDMGDLYRIALFERGRVAEVDKELGKAAEFYRQAVEAVESVEAVEPWRSGPECFWRSSPGKKKKNWRICFKH